MLRNYYPNFVAKAALDSNVLITVSNDAHLESIGPKQSPNGSNESLRKSKICFEE